MCLGATVGPEAPYEAFVLCLWHTVVDITCTKRAMMRMPFFFPRASSTVLNRVLFQWIRWSYRERQQAVTGRPCKQVTAVRSEEEREKPHLMRGCMWTEVNETGREECTASVLIKYTAELSLLAFLFEIPTKCHTLVVDL